ncbi:MAG: TraB/GumN family protein [Xanthomonadales bacterium]|nr:TraB/GumN family protein [Xanthomonadales bacterium]
MSATAHIPEGLKDQPIEVVEKNGVTYTLLGTAHVSRRSVEAVRELIAGHAFDAVAVELCRSRYDALTDPDAWQKMDLFRIIRERKAGLVAANLALGAYQRRLAEQFGIEPGAEMKAALEAAEDGDTPHLLVDRDIGISLKRVFRAVGFWEKLTILGGLGASLFSRETISEEEIERLKEGDMLESTFAEFATQSEALFDSLISERDQFMAARLQQESEGKHEHVLVVIGAGHLAGTVRRLKGESDTDEESPAAAVERLNRIPPGRRWTRWIPWIITAVILLGFSIGFYRSPELGWQLVTTWVLINGTLAAAGALAAGGHPLTILSGFLAAPLTSLNPTIAAGMVTASVETALRKPTVSDFSSLRDDVIEISGWWKNRVSRILLVLILSNLGSILGTWIAGFRIFERLT